MIKSLSEYIELNAINQNRVPRFARLDCVLDAVRTFEIERDSSQVVLETKQSLINNLKENLLF